MNFEFWEAAGLVRCPKKYRQSNEQTFDTCTNRGIWPSAQLFFYDFATGPIDAAPRPRKAQPRKEQRTKDSPRLIFTGCPNPAAWLRGTPAYPKAALATPKLFCGTVKHSQRLRCAY
jgi:hypothetical protein